LLLDIPEGALRGPTIVKITPVVESELPHPVPSVSRFIAGINVDTGGVRFEKEVHLSIPVPADLPADAVPFVAQPKLHHSADGSEEEVYVILDSTKIADGRLTTASPPFDGIMGFGLFTFLYANPDGPGGAGGGQVVISGIAYRDMNDLPGYQEGVDRPISGAIVRCPAADNHIAYTNDAGHYASYGFTDGGACRNFYVIGIHPQTLLTVYERTSACSAPYLIKNLDLKLAGRDTLIPDTIAPAISLNLQVAPGQAAGARIIAGTVPLGTELTVPVSVVDQALEGTSLTVEFKTPDMPEAVTLPAQLTPLTTPTQPELYRALRNEAEPALWRTSYEATFAATEAGATPALFRPAVSGSYTFTVEATDEAGNQTTRSVQVRAVNSGEQGTGIDGPPLVDEILPGHGAREIMVTTPVIVTFSEPVDNVTNATLRLLDLETDTVVPAFVYTSLEGGQMRATLQPRRNLQFAHNYRVVVDAAITDMLENPGFGNAKLPLDHEVSADFATKTPHVYDLDEDERFTGSIDIARYDHPASGRSYAYITTRYEGWRIVDITDPTAPRVEKAFPAQAVVNYRGIAVDSQSGVLGITDWIRYASGNQFAYVRFYDIAADPINPPYLGQERLAEGPGIPLRLALADGHAYVATAGIGVQVVDVEAARADSGFSDGSSLVGLFDSISLGYGTPNDIQFYASAKAMVTTNSGTLLLLDTGFPAVPRLVGSYPEAGRAQRAAAVSGYSYNDADGNTAVIDLAVIVGLGTLQTLDISDPYAPQLLGTAVDQSGAEVAVIANDIAIIKDAGLAFVSNFASVQIFDIKDPLHPLLLQTLTQLPDADGNLVPLGGGSSLMEKDGWVCLASETEGMKVIETAPQFKLVLTCDPNREPCRGQKEM
jgi:hypothetical protein